MSVIDYSWDFSKEEFSLDLDYFNEKEQEDKLWQARTGLDHETLCGAIETIIFMQERPINLLKIKNYIDPDLPLRVVHESIARLQDEYELKHHGIRLMEVAQGYQFRTKATYAKIVQKMFKVQSMQLSPTAVEVLAIISYKQPISKTAIESIRGVDSSHVVRALMDRRLVKVVGRSDEMGRPSLYGTTPEFLEVFNLNSIDDLPSEIELEEIANANEVGQISDIKNIVQTGDKKRFDMDELLELDKLSESIQEIASDTLFTKSLKDMDKGRGNEEGVEKKSAFDILEEYVNKAQIIEQNKLSENSEVLTSIMEPKVVELSKIMTEDFNIPNEEEDEHLQKTEFEELDSSSVKEIEQKASDVLHQSEEMIKSLEEEVDLAFDSLLDQGEDNSDELDLSSFISHKVERAQNEEDSETKEEEAELAAALEQAFKKLSISDETQQQAKDLDIDVEFLNKETLDQDQEEQRE